MRGAQLLQKSLNLRENCNFNTVSILTCYCTLNPPVYKQLSFPSLQAKHMFMLGKGMHYIWQHFEGSSTQCYEELNAC